MTSFRIIKAAAKCCNMTYDQFLDSHRKMSSQRPYMAAAAQLISESGKPLAYVAHKMRRDRKTIWHHLNRGVNALGVQEAKARIIAELSDPKKESRVVVLPFPAGVDRMLRNGVALSEIKRQHPEWVVPCR